MKYLKDTRVIIAILIVFSLIIKEIGKSVRINQLKEIEKSKIESMGEYEKNSKTEYLKTFESIGDSETSSE
ncbi:hypothetical protein WJN01_04040 [Flavobacteriaceae bacterium SZ-1-7]|uniref:hypothetical protein n=1 Tax=Tamlana sedimenti TaxID=3134126 RepID=UPI003125D5C9